MDIITNILMLLLWLVFGFCCFGVLCCQRSESKVALSLIGLIVLSIYLTATAAGGLTLMVYLVLAFLLGMFFTQNMKKLA